MFLSFTKLNSRHALLNWFLLAFIVTALLGVWAAYNSELAWNKFLLIVGAVLIYFALSLRPFSSPGLLTTICCTGASLAVCYFLFTNDWSQTPASLASINSIALRLMELRPKLGISQFDPNAAEGIMTVLFPVILGQGIWAVRCKKWLLAMVIALVTSFVTVGLLFSTSRGAWVALAIGLSVWVLWAVIKKQKQIRLSNKLSLVILIVLFGLAFIIFFLTVNNVIKLPRFIIDSERIVLIKDTIDLIADFPFTGSGLDTFSGLYSQYILIIPFLYSTHSHNLFLSITLEQGMGGLLAFCGALLTTVWLLLNTSITTSRFPDEKYLPLFVGSLFASVTVLIIHGLIDDPFYSTKALLFLFFIPGLVVSLQSPEDKSINILPQMTLGLSVASVIAVLIIFAFRSSLLAAFQANLGAVAMAKVELQTWPNIEWNDERNLAYLGEAEDLFGKALTYSPTNRTARQRLGSIAMLRGDYDEAIVHLEVANQVDFEHRGVRKTLGYSYVWAGEIDSALRILEEIPEAEEELKTYVWWWGTKGRDDLVIQADTIVTEMAKQTP